MAKKAKDDNQANKRHIKKNEKLQAKKRFKKNRGKFMAERAELRTLKNQMQVYSKKGLVSKCFAKLVGVADILRIR